MEYVISSALSRQIKNYLIDNHIGLYFEIVYRLKFSLFLQLF